MVQLREYFGGAERPTGMRPIYLSLLLAAACATSRASGSGTVALKSFGYPAARPETYSVGKGLISGSNLELRVDDAGCMRGFYRSEPINLCRDAADPNHWVGASGDLIVVPSPDRKAVNVQGWMNIRGIQQLDVTQVIPLGNGPTWDELRRNPVLLAIATTTTDLDARRSRA